ncbi:unnamed protein product [Amoebophrya sp. A120]|nr:unnamed protein product [Amoebophrya sp. A120]|eukprot:GSA120T00016395001.1
MIHSQLDSTQLDQDPGSEPLRGCRIARQRAFVCTSPASQISHLIWDGGFFHFDRNTVTGETVAMKRMKLQDYVSTIIGGSTAPA